MGGEDNGSLNLITLPPVVDNMWGGGGEDNGSLNLITLPPVVDKLRSCDGGER